MVRKIFVFVFALANTAAFAQSDTGVYSPRKITEFAGHLYSRAYFSEAAGQYEWLWRSNRSDTFSARMMLQSWRAANKYQQGLDKGKSLFDSGYVISGAVFREYIALSAWSGHYHHGFEALISKQSSHEDSLTHLINLSLISHDFKRSAGLIAYAQAQNINLAKQQEFQIKSSEITHRKPWLAAGLSAVVPGSGKVYAGEWKDGLFSFCSIALLGVQSYVGFRKDGWKSPFGLISGGLAVSFYSANIYGSAKSARKFNQLSNRKFSNEALSTFYPAP